MRNNIVVKSNIASSKKTSNGYKIRRGQICWYHFPDAGKCVQSGIRPCLVVGNDKQNQSSEVVVVVPITTAKKRLLPTHVNLADFFCSVKGIVLCEQIFTIHVNDLNTKNGNILLSSYGMDAVDRALSIELNIENRCHEKVEIESITSEFEHKYQEKLKQYQDEIALLKQTVKRYRYLFGSDSGFVNMIENIPEEVITEQKKLKGR